MLYGDYQVNAHLFKEDEFAGCALLYHTFVPKGT